ncbi:hypothetical protein L873DRAFT_422629 [Choiromyces venosus 120613-1]|uniref:Uncharacterized protein n=1 Tax=Choiromyces venosus 120613-1 TaxID=1336337 RepID=A0A3N4K2J7_9PEZI|nr:hypothetical protein L873DRAFT_422629 [Choiromyces venosus 120613-1]
MHAGDGSAGISFFLFLNFARAERGLPFGHPSPGLLSFTFLGMRGEGIYRQDQCGGLHAVVNQLAKMEHGVEIRRWRKGIINIPFVLKNVMTRRSAEHKRESKQDRANRKAIAHSIAESLIYFHFHFDKKNRYNIVLLYTGSGTKQLEATYRPE